MKKKNEIVLINEIEHIYNVNILKNKEVKIFIWFYISSKKSKIWKKHQINSSMIQKTKRKID